MYSRYIPKENGGYERRELPDAADLRAAQSRPPPQAPTDLDPPLPRPPTEAGPGPEERAAPPPEAPSAAPNSGPGSRRFPGFPPGTASPPPRPGPPPSRSPLPGVLPGPGGLLAQLLPHGLDSEDLLILAILLLCMKQDGASPTELLMATGLYFWL